MIRRRKWIGMQLRFARERPKALILEHRGGIDGALATEPAHRDQFLRGGGTTAKAEVFLHTVIVYSNYGAHKQERPLDDLLPGRLHLSDAVRQNWRGRGVRERGFTNACGLSPLIVSALVPRWHPPFGVA